jgi:hypothetical protein
LNGNWKISILLYGIVIVIAILIIWIINKFDKDKTAEKTIKEMGKNKD